MTHAQPPQAPSLLAPVLPEAVTRENALWVYDIQSRQLRRQTPKDTGAIGYFNAWEDRDGNRSFVIEEALSKIEGATAQVMLKIEARQNLSDEDRHTLAHFVALQMLRGPDFHEDMSNVNDALMRHINEFIFADREIGERLWNKADKELGGNSGVSFDEAQELILGGTYSIQTHRNWTLELMLELAPNFADIFLRQEWIVFCAPPAEAFVTCDRPFSIVPPPVEGPCLFRGAGIATRGTIKLMPLSLDRCLGIGNPGDLFDYADSDAEAVRMWNLQVCNGALRFVIGCDRALVNSLVTRTRQAHSKRGTEWGGSRFVLG